MTKHAVEARVHRRLDNAGGVYVTFQIHADDTNAVDGVRVGNTVVLAWEDVASTNVEKIEVPENRAAKGEDAKASPRERLKRKWDELSAPEQAGILSNDFEFQLYASGLYADCPGVLSAADFIRRKCNVDSRSKIEKGNVKWQDLIHDFRNWQAQQRYAESIRR